MSATTEYATELSVELPFCVTTDEGHLAMAVRLLETGCISLGQAANLARCSKHTFMDVLEREGIAVVNNRAGDRERELSR